MSSIVCFDQDKCYLKRYLRLSRLKCSKRLLRNTYKIKNNFFQDNLLLNWFYGTSNRVTLPHLYYNIIQCIILQF